MIYIAFVVGLLLGALVTLVAIAGAAIAEMETGPMPAYDEDRSGRWQD